MNLSQVFFPFPRVREGQKELVLDIASVLSQKKHLVAHAPTGLGKTVSALAPAITFALQEGKTVFFLTPKISQHQLAVDVVRQMASQFKLNLKAVDLVGKKYLCSDPLLGSTDFEGFYHVCSKRVRKEQCPFYKNAVGYSKSDKEIAGIYLDKIKNAFGSVKNHYELKELAVNMRGTDGERPMCAYEVAHQIAKESQVVIGDYFHVLNPSIQKVTLQRMGKKLEDTILIIDEAHNLSERLRKILGSSLSTISLRNAAEELRLMNLVALRSSCKLLEKTIKKVAKNRVSSGAVEALVSKEILLDELKEITDLEAFADELNSAGVEFLEASGKSKSFLVGVSNFLQKWVLDLPATVRIIKRLNSEGEFSVSIQALDAAMVSRDIFEKTHSTILMSGTLLPTKMYADLLGLSEGRTILKEYGNPFPKENHLRLLVTDVTTKFSKRSEKEFEKIALHIAEIVNSVPGNSAVFFPSFHVLEAVGFFLSGKIPRELIKQRPKMSSGERAAQIERFRGAASGFGAVMLAVSNGSYSEGLDYPGNQLLCSIIV
ncbi:MAG: ATP-dependent DNA helicase, partial [Candidatus Diapherotrites archaeon]|nr:ATP-dependent DNA helicase [Candidatus Diapherotrites archaeon]